MSNPLLIALVGHPTSGKTEVQNILSVQFATFPIDDFAVVRSFCGELFGFSHEEMTSQMGKAEVVKVGDVEMERRQFLGEMGSLIEKRFGSLTIPNAAIRQVVKNHRYFVAPAYVFGSVRRIQPRAYKAAGGLVVEITRPGVGPSGNLWDDYERKDINFTIANDGTLKELEQKVREAFSPYLRPANEPVEAVA